MTGGIVLCGHVRVVYAFRRRDGALRREAARLDQLIGLGGFSLATILIAVLFGLIGFAAFRYGRKNDEPRPLFLGIALMAYGYFVTNAWVSFGIGALLTLLIFFPR